MSKQQQARMGTLYEEHVLLGAKLEPSEDGGDIRAMSYPSESAELDPGKANLADLTGSSYYLVSGKHAHELMEAGFCSNKLQVGKCAWMASLTAEGALTSIPLVVRTGNDEYALIDPSARGEVAPAWLGFLAGIEQNGFAPYEGTKLEDATRMLVPLLMAGNSARTVLSDYVEHPRDLPQPGEVKDLKLDKIGCVVAGVPVPGTSLPVFLVLVPPARARILWRSFLSFEQVAPLGAENLTRAEKYLLPWGDLLSETNQVKPSKEQLTQWVLLRAEQDFVGARSL